MAKIRLTESKLKQIVAEAVHKVLNENFIDTYGNDWEKGYEADKRKTAELLAAKKEKHDSFLLSPKVKQLKRMGVSDYNIQRLEDYYDGDISNVPMDELKKRLAYYKEVDSESYEDDEDYNTKIKHDPTLSDLMRHQMVGEAKSLKRNGAIEINDDWDYHIDTADVSILKKVKSGKMSLKDAAIEFHKLGWTNFVDIDATKRILQKTEEKNF